MDRGWSGTINRARKPLNFISSTNSPMGDSSGSTWISKQALAWVILIFAALNVIFLGGKRRAFGTFVAEWQKDFKNVSMVELNWIGDSYSAFGHLTSGLSCTMIIYFNRRYCLFQFIGAVFILISCIVSAYVPNPHWMFLTITVLHGMGSSLVISTVGLIANEHFGKKHKYHILATTLVSGGSIASIIFITMFAYLISIYNWRNALLILGAMYFILMATSAFTFRKNEDLTQVAGSAGTTCNFKRVTRPQIPLLILWFIDRMMTSVVTYGILMNLTSYVYRDDTDLVGSTILTTLFAGGEGSTYLIGAIITGITKDFFKNRVKYILIGSSLLMSASLIALTFTTEIKVAREVLCFVAGFGLGPSNTFTFPGGEELTRLPGHLAYPFSLVGIGSGMLISPLLTAMIAQAYSYKMFFLVQGCLIFVKVFCLLVITLLLFCYDRYGLILDYPTLLPSSINDALDDEHTLIIPEESMKNF